MLNARQSLIAQRFIYCLEFGGDPYLLFLNLYHHLLEMTVPALLSPTRWAEAIFDFYYVIVQRIIVWLFKPVCPRASTAMYETYYMRSPHRQVPTIPNVQRAG